jgi:CRP-like cAMP-binding protein
MATTADLSGIPLFTTLSEDERATLAPLFDVQTPHEGDRIVIEGASGYSFFVLIEGAAVVTLGDEIVATYGPGDFFGEMAILGPGGRTATVTATEPSRVLVLFGTDFRQLEQEHPEIASQLEDAMRKRAAELEDLRPGSTAPGPNT